ncbi:MAG TPA: TetR/AcrR family transcriptional regulator [Ktedonobacteraceae bacterium]
MPRTEDANQRIRQEQRSRILAAALGVFARKGTEATMAEVACAAEVSYGLVYRYFVSKEALLFELVESALNKSLRVLTEGLEMPGTPGERLRLLLTQITDGVREHPEFILLVQQMLGESAEQARPANGTGSQVLAHEEAREHLRQLAREQSRTYRAVLKQLIIEGQATGEIARDDPDQLVAALTACVAGLSQAATWQAPADFQKTFPDSGLLFRILVAQSQEKTYA